MTPEQPAVDLNMSGLRILARIVAKSYLTDAQRGIVAGKAIEGDKYSEVISRTGRNNKNNKRGK